MSMNSNKAISVAALAIMVTIVFASAAVLTTPNNTPPTNPATTPAPTSTPTHQNSGTHFYVGEQDSYTDIAVLEGTVLATRYFPVIYEEQQATPDATEFQNTTLTYGDMIDQVLSWVASGNLIDTVTGEGISGQTITVVDATDNSTIYGTVVTSEGGYFELNWAVMAPPTVQIVFAGDNQYLAVTSSSIELPLP